MIVGVLKLSLFLRGNRSLKGKRHVTKKIKDRIKARYNVSISEIDASESWERFYIGISMIGDDGKFMDSVLNKIKTDIDALCLAEILDENIEFISYE